MPGSEANGHGIMHLHQLLVLFFQTQNENGADKENCHEDPEHSLTLDAAVNPIISYNCGFCACVQWLEWELFSLLSLVLAGLWKQDFMWPFYNRGQVRQDRSWDRSTRLNLWNCSWYHWKGRGSKYKAHLGGFYGVKWRQGICGTGQKAQVASVD